MGGRAPPAPARPPPASAVFRDSRRSRRAWRAWRATAPSGKGPSPPARCPPPERSAPPRRSPPRPIGRGGFRSTHAPVATTPPAAGRCPAKCQSEDHRIGRQASQPGGVAHDVPRRTTGARATGKTPSRRDTGPDRPPFSWRECRSPHRPHPGDSRGPARRGKRSGTAPRRPAAAVAALQKITSKSAVKRRPRCPKNRPYAGSAMFPWKASGLKWLVRLYVLKESRTVYFGFTLISLENRESTKRNWGSGWSWARRRISARHPSRCRETRCDTPPAGAMRKPFGKLQHAPCQEPVGQVGRQIAELVAANDAEPGSCPGNWRNRSGRRAPGSARTRRTTGGLRARGPARSLRTGGTATARCPRAGTRRFAPGAAGGTGFSSTSPDDSLCM